MRPLPHIQLRPLLHASASLFLPLLLTTSLLLLSNKALHTQIHLKNSALGQVPFDKIRLS